MKSLLTLSVILMTCSLASAVTAHPTSHTAAAKAPYDAQYLDSMTKHHQDGIMMFNMAIEKAAMPAVKAKAQMMAQMQQQDIKDMQAMRSNIQSDAQPAVNMKLPGMMPMNMKPLQSASGMGFDTMFIDMTIKHHEDAIKMSKDALSHSKTPGVRAMAQKVIDDSNKDIADLKAMKTPMQ